MQKGSIVEVVVGLYWSDQIIGADNLTFIYKQVNFLDPKSP